MWLMNGPSDQNIRSQETTGHGVVLMLAEELNPESSAWIKSGVKPSSKINPSTQTLLQATGKPFATSALCALYANCTHFRPDFL
jgi:hypothetical protein